LARLRKDDFSLVIKPIFHCRKDAYWAQTFSLLYKAEKEPTPPELQLDLPFFDYVFKRYEGEIVQELSAFYSNRLEDFKGKLLHLCGQNTQKEEKGILRLLRVCPDRRFEELTFAITDSKFEVI
jgi:hypothetical protein